MTAPIAKATCEFLGRIYFGWDFFYSSYPTPPLTVKKIYVKCPQEQNKTEEVQTRKKRRKEEGKSKALQLGIQQALSFEGFF